LTSRSQSVHLVGRRSVGRTQTKMETVEWSTSPCTTPATVACHRCSSDVLYRLHSTAVMRT